MDSDWVGAGADVFAALGTVGAFATGFLLLRREMRREARRTEDERRTQATQISAWVELYTRADGSRELAFHIHNASAMPIYEVELPLPGAEGTESVEFVGLVPPGQTIRRPAPSDWLRTYTDPEPVEIEFQDSAGRHWRRDEQGTLRESS